MPGFRGNCSQAAQGNTRSLLARLACDRGNRPRRIPLCDRALEIIRAQAPEEPAPSDPIFVGENDRQFIRSALHCRLRRLRRKYPELEGFSFHKLRHTCTTYPARLDVPERVTQAILGHSSTLMTYRYMATWWEEIWEAVEKLSERTEAREYRPGYRTIFRALPTRFRNAQTVDDKKVGKRTCIGSRGLV